MAKYTVWITYRVDDVEANFMEAAIGTARSRIERYPSSYEADPAPVRSGCRVMIQQPAPTGEYQVIEGNQ